MSRAVRCAAREADDSPRDQASAPISSSSSAAHGNGVAAMYVAGNRLGSLSLTCIISFLESSPGE